MENSSNRLLGLSCGEPNGSAEVLLKAALRSAEDVGATVELVRLADLRIPSDPNEPNGADLSWLWEKLVSSDALVISTPIICRTINARFKLLADRLLGVNADAAVTEAVLAARRAGGEPLGPFRADERILRPRVAGFIAVGGSLEARWKTLTLPLMHVTVVPMQIAVVDQVQFAGGGTPRSILLDPTAVERAGLLGRHVASQMGRSFEDAQYCGDPGLCPMCHLDVVVLHGRDVECATCGAVGEFGDNARVRWTDLTTSIISMHEKRAHFREMLETGRRHAAQRDTIRARFAAFDAYDRVVSPDRQAEPYVT
ncbi:flavodoxin family protein [Streptomyces sediminimaris]|uniref:flavodoxin family protein n=1 Tax=Streptomyces sediminimaris TaxID=3383721 RepID=UPI00399BA65C